MSKRSDALKQVEQYKKDMNHIIGKPLVIAFDKFSFPIVIESIELAKLGDLENKPDTRIDDEGKGYKPPVMQIKTDVGMLYFVLEDIKLAAIFNGVQIETESIKVILRMAS